MERAEAVGEKCSDGTAESIICVVKGERGERAMKVRALMVKVYEPGRLQQAWHWVRQNAGVAGDRPNGILA